MLQSEFKWKAGSTNQWASEKRANASQFQLKINFIVPLKNSILGERQMLFAIRPTLGYLDEFSNSEMNQCTSYFFLFSLISVHLYLGQLLGQVAEVVKITLINFLNL